MEMKVAVVTKSRKGGLFLSPSNFGEKIEFIARMSGEFKEDEVVIALECIHDTKPEEPHKGARFIRVRRPEPTEIEELAKSKTATLERVATGAEQDCLIIDEIIYLDCGGWRSLGLRVRTRKIKKEDLTLNVNWFDSRGKTGIRLWECKEMSPETSIKVSDSDNLTREILEKVFGYDVAAEQEKEAAKQVEAAAAYAKKEAEAAEAWKEEEKRRIALFFSCYPDAREWFTSPPTWEDIKKETISRKLARYLRTENTGHYASFSKEFDIFERIWELVVGEEKFVFASGSYVVEEDGSEGYD